MRKVIPARMVRRACPKEFIPARTDLSGWQAGIPVCVLLIMVISYHEFLAFNNLDNTVERFDNYLLTGGMPEFVKHRNANILLNLVDDILYRDIAVRHNIRNVNGLRELTVYLMSNIGKPIAARPLTGLFGLSATSTIIEYFTHLQ
jgi:hypothetical protein